MRAYGSYLRQIGAPFGQVYLGAARSPGMAASSRDLVPLFHILFDPARGQSIAEREAAAAPIVASIEGALERCRASTRTG